MKKLLPLIALLAVVAAPALAQTPSYRAAQSVSALGCVQDDIVVISRGRIVDENPRASNDPGMWKVSDEEPVPHGLSRCFP